MSTKKTSIIGTLHSGYTSEEELSDILTDFEPNQILVELPENFEREDVENREVVSEEMLFTHGWTKNNDVPVACFDVQPEDVDYFTDE